MRSASSSESERAETFAGDRAACIPVAVAIVASRAPGRGGWVVRSLRTPFEDGGFLERERKITYAIPGFP